MVCLDTNILIAFLRGNKKIIKLIKEYSLNEEVCSTTITEYELRKYHSIMNEVPELSVLENITLYPFDRVAARRASEIFEALKEKGKMINENDILIAAIALAKNEILLTGDRDFNNIASGRIIII